MDNCDYSMCILNLSTVRVSKNKCFLFYCSKILQYFYKHEIESISKFSYMFEIHG